MTVNPNDVLEVTTIGEFDGTEDVINVYQFRMIGTSALSDEDAVSDLADIVRAVIDFLKGALSVLLIIRRFKLRNVTQNVLMGDVSFDEPLAGEMTGDPGPAGACLLMTMRTNISHVVLRKYFGVFTEAAYNSIGQFVSGVINAGVDVGNYLLDDIVGTFGGTWQYGTMSEKTGTWKVPGSLAVYSEPAYQRRRRRGAGS